MLYERQISSFPELIKELGILDLDAGIRAFCKYKSKKCLVFVTRSVKGYASAVYTLKKVGKRDFPEKQLLLREFEKPEELENFLGEVITKPVKAYYY